MAFHFQLWGHFLGHPVQSYMSGLSFYNLTNDRVWNLDLSWGILIRLKRQRNLLIYDFIVSDRYKHLA